jgi:hypothetical protein
MAMRSQFNSKDAAIVAIASATLGVVESMIFSTVYPLLPPIVIVPFLTCFFFGVTLAFSKKQLAIGVVCFLVTALVRGTMMPGQLMIPICRIDTPRSVRRSLGSIGLLCCASYGCSFLGQSVSWDF